MKAVYKTWKSEQRYSALASGTALTESIGSEAEKDRFLKLSQAVNAAVHGLFGTGGLSVEYFRDNLYRILSEMAQQTLPPDTFLMTSVDYQLREYLASVGWFREATQQLNLQTANERVRELFQSIVDAVGESSRTLAKAADIGWQKTDFSPDVGPFLARAYGDIQRDYESVRAFGNAGADALIRQPLRDLGWLTVVTGVQRVLLRDAASKNVFVDETYSAQLLSAIGEFSARFVLAYIRLTADKAESADEAVLGLAKKAGIAVE